MVREAAIRPRERAYRIGGLEPPAAGMSESLVEQRRLPPRAETILIRLPRRHDLRFALAGLDRRQRVGVAEQTSVVFGFPFLRMEFPQRGGDGDAGASNAARSTTANRTPPHFWPLNLLLVGVNSTGAKVTPGSPRAESSAASLRPSSHGAPTISNGVSEPRPTDRLVVSSRPIPG
jgi:hypothetical protein